MAQALGAEPGVRVVNQVDLNQVAVRFGSDDRSGDTLTSKVIDRIQAEGTCFAAGAQWKGLWIMRLSVTSWFTTEAEADRSIAAIIDAWRAVQLDEA